jgi:chromosome segregation protein
LGALVAEENTLQGDISDAKARLSALASAAQEMYDREKQVALDTQEASDRYRALEAERAACSADAAKARDELAGIKNVISGYSLRVESRRKRAEAAGERKMKLTMELGSLRSRISLLAEMEKDYQDIPRRSSL